MDEEAAHARSKSLIRSRVRDLNTQCHGSHGSAVISCDLLAIVKIDKDKSNIIFSQVMAINAF